MGLVGSIKHNISICFRKEDVVKLKLLDKKAISAFLEKKNFKGRVISSHGSELRAMWGTCPLIAKWDKKEKLILIPTEDNGVKRVQNFLKEE